MKKKSAYLKYLTLFSLILSICAVGVSFYRVGCAIDEYGMIVPELDWWWLALGLAVGVFFVMEYLYSEKIFEKLVKNKSRLVLVLHCVCALTICCSICAAADMNIQVQKTYQEREAAKMSRIQNTLLDSVSSDGFSK